MVVKMSISIQAMFMLGLKPNSFYDPNLKNSLGYQNPFTLKKEISLNPKLYDASYLHNLKVRVDVCDTEEILEDATKSRLKMKRKLDDPTTIEKRLIESELYETLKQNELLNGRLLEAILTHDVEKYVLLHSETMKHILNVEIKKVKMQSIDFELQLQHQKEKTDCEQSLKNLCENSWISKMEKLENENVSLEFQVQYLNKELEHVKLVYHKLFDSIKKTRSQTQKQVNELIESVNQKTYAYGDVRS
ncbi:hypothetical protein Tco_1209294 [Tanacetum coccineum]